MEYLQIFFYGLEVVISKSKSKQREGKRRQGYQHGHAHSAESSGLPFTAAAAMTTLSTSLLSPHQISPSFWFCPNKNIVFSVATRARRVRRSGGEAVKSKGGDSVDVPDRVISAVCYFYPFFDGVQYGKYVMAQVSPVQMLIQPLVPAIRVFKSFPFNGFLVFFLLYFVVVRNPNNFSRYVRFNTMQAIMLDVLLILPDLLERSFNPRDGFGLDLMMSFDSTVFLFLLVSLIYGSSSCLLGQLPRLPIVAEAADTQVL